MTEKEARKLVLKHPVPTQTGWLLACDSLDNIAKGQRMISDMTPDDAQIAIAYRHYCVAIYQAARMR